MKLSTMTSTMLASSLLLAGMTSGPAIADDGERLVRSVSSPPGNTEDPEPEGEHAFIKTMNFHVPAQSADGELRDGTGASGEPNSALEYINIDGDLVKTEIKAKPLVNVYVYGPVIGFDNPEASGFAGHGRRDAYGAISLDDGETWKVTNLSNSADESSFEVATPLQDPGKSEPSLITDYPGDVPNVFHAVAGNKVMVAWHSKYCSSGNPVWADEYPTDDVAIYLGIDNEVDLYLTDMFGAAGSQSSTDYNPDNAPVGEVPYSCLWSARGVLREDPENTDHTEVVWFQAERLTSGARDVNRVETACVAGAGCAVSWQEDPEGVRPGEGEGPGTGWSGATTSSKTDVWYSFVEWEDFDIVEDDGEPLPLADNIVGGRPQVFVPMMAAARLTNNDRCQTDAADGYCSDLALPYGIKDQCIDTVEVPLGPQGNPREICVVDANGDDVAGPGDMANLANNAASRPRLNLQPRDSDGDDVVDDAWVIVVSEEDKGLGAYSFLNDEEWDFDLENTGTVCDADDTNLENCDKADQGKDVFWATFNLGSPATSEGIDVDHSLVENVLFQGAQLNQPENNWRTGDFYRPMDTTDMWDFGDYDYLIFNTEIARRTSMMSQPTSKGSLVAMPLWKQGIVNQGGPADIMTRRFVYNQCPIHEEDPEGPVISKVDWVQYLAGGANIKIKGTVSELDELKKTGFFIRDAVNYNYVFFEENSAPKDWENFLAENMEYPPCYIQASDEAPAADGTSVGNWGEAFDLTPFWDEIGVECECIIPENQSTSAAPESSSWLSLHGISDAVAAMKQSASAAVESFSWLSLLGISDAVAYTQPGSTSENPYDFTNMECAYYDGEGNVTEGVMYFEDGLNPKYPMGLCMAPAMNLSARTPFTCEASGDSDGLCSGEGAAGSESDLVCEEVAGFGQLCQTTTDPDNSALYDKMLSWYECPGWDGENVSNDDPAEVPEACGTEALSADVYGSNRDDQSWFMPLEVSKAHRGFIDGDYVSMIYAWSPNFKLNAVGNDRYELYTRRSFDGGLTWTTTPGSFSASNDESYSGQGAVTCETWRDGETSQDDNHVCTDYAAGDVEQSRNVSQLKSMATTILDPRYTAAGGIPPKGVPEEGDLDWGIFEPIDPTDILNPSRYFVVFEDGDNTTVSEGEAEPLNLGYGRGEMFGDNFTVWAETDTGFGNGIADCYPNNTHGDTDAAWAEGTGFCNEFDTLEGFKDALSEEASITASAHGDFLYSVWGQFNVDEDGEFIDGDSMFRRVWYLDDYISDTEAWTLPGTQ